jgi:NAD(P)-dependent dehydrogenase (short-subunit alcohol dehydrogenase family)
MAQHILIVGGSSDIGKEVAREAIAIGHHVVLFVRDETRVQDLAQAGATVIVGDAKSIEDMNKILDYYETTPIDAVVHCVGSIVLRPPHAMKLPDFVEVLETNLVTAFITLSLIGKKMLKAGTGRMIFVSSVAASYGLTNHEAISAAKGGLEAMVRSAASTYAQRGLRVNAVAPGLTKTRLSESIRRSPAMEEAATQLVPIRIINEASDVSKTISWLLFDAPDTMTGQIRHVDAGMSKIRG